MAPRAQPTVAIVGGGLAGASCARHFAEAGARVLLLDHAAEASATRAAAGIMHPLTGRRARLAPFHREGFEHTLRLLTALAEDRNLLRGRGVLRAALTDDQARLWAEGAADLPPDLARWLDAERAQQTCGPLSPQCRGGLWIPNAVAVDLPAFARALRQHPAVHCLPSERVQRILPGPHGVRLETATNALVAADHVVLATGTGTARLLLASDLPPIDVLVPARGELATFACTDGTLPRVTISSGGYVIPNPAARTLTVGATFDEREPWAGTTAQGLVELERIARRLLPGETTLALVRLACGVRPATRDRVPRVGPLPGHDRVSLCTGHGAKGLLLAPLSARMLTRRVLGGDPDAIPPRWRP